MSRVDVDRLIEDVEAGDVLATVTLLRHARRVNDKDLLEFATNAARHIIGGMESDIDILSAAIGDSVTITPPPVVIPSPAPQPRGPYATPWTGPIQPYTWLDTGLGDVTTTYCTGGTLQ